MKSLSSQQLSYGLPVAFVPALMDLIIGRDAVSASLNLSFGKWGRRHTIPPNLSYGVAFSLV